MYFDDFDNKLILFQEIRNDFYEFIVKKMMVIKLRH